MEKPWSCFAQTTVPYSGTGVITSKVNNPKPNSIEGVIGVCNALPYVVPEGYELEINSMQLENYWGASLLIFIGESSGPPFSLPTLSAQATPNISWNNVLPSVQYTDLNWRLAAGTKLNVRFIAHVNQPNLVLAWGICGRLISVSE